MFHVFENTENTILVFSENCFLFSEFNVFCVFHKKKRELNVFSVCSLFSLFLEQNQFLKIINKQVHFVCATRLICSLWGFLVFQESL